MLLAGEKKEKMLLVGEIGREELFLAGEVKV